MVKTRDPFKKIGDTKGTFHAKMETIKDRSDKDLTEGTTEGKGWIWQNHRQENLIWRG